MSDDSEPFQLGAVHRCDAIFDALGERRIGRGGRRGDRGRRLSPEAAADPAVRLLLALVRDVDDQYVPERRQPRTWPRSAWPSERRPPGRHAAQRHLHPPGRTAIGVAAAAVLLTSTGVAAATSGALAPIGDIIGISASTHPTTPRPAVVSSPSPLPPQPVTRKLFAPPTVPGVPATAPLGPRPAAAAPAGSSPPVAVVPAPHPPSATTPGATPTPDPAPPPSATQPPAWPTPSPSPTPTTARSADATPPRGGFAPSKPPASSRRPPAGRQPTPSASGPTASGTASPTPSASPDAIVWDEPPDGLLASIPPPSS